MQQVYFGKINTIYREQCKLAAQKQTAPARVIKKPKSFGGGTGLRHVLSPRKQQGGSAQRGAAEGESVRLYTRTLLLGNLCGVSKIEKGIVWINRTA